MSRLRQFALLGMSISLLVFVWLLWGHYYRFPLSDVGISRTEAFDETLFLKVRSKRGALKYIEETYNPKGEEETLFAVYDFVKKRFYHMDYPRHSWMTNPLYPMLKMRNPNWTQDELATADELLRHSPSGACSDVSKVVTELYRGFGYPAQYVDLVGHQVVEARANGKYWIVDADLEAIAPYSIADIRANPDILEEIYSDKASEINGLKKIYQKVKGLSGYDGVPHNDVPLYRLHVMVDAYKWYPPIVGFILFFLVWLFARRPI